MGELDCVWKICKACGETIIHPCDHDPACMHSKSAYDTLKKMFDDRGTSLTTEREKRVEVERELVEMARAFTNMVHRVDTDTDKRVQYDEWVMDAKAQAIINKAEGKKDV